MAVLNPFDFFLAPYAESTPFEYEATELSELAPYLQRSEATPLFAEYLARIPRPRCAPSISWSTSISASRTISAT